MDPRRFFSPDEQAAVAAAARAAEGRTSGEIVPYVVGRCDDYAEAAWAGAALGALLSVGVAATWPLVTDTWAPAGLVWRVLPPLAGAAAGYALTAFVPAVARRLVPAATLDRRAHLRAEAAFLEEEVFDTRDRTGILILLALFERRAVVMADAGIHARVAPGAWDAVVSPLVAGIRAGRPAEALIKAIGRCGDILETHQVTRHPDDHDELTDDLRIRSE